MKVTIPSVSPALRIVDYAMMPLMYILGGLKRDSIQETHPWHTYRGFEPTHIDNALAVTCDGTDKTHIKGHGLFLFHAALLGGWTDYAYVVPTSDTRPFYVGWIVTDTHTGKRVDYGINKLPINDVGIRLLVGPANRRTVFFAYNKVGEQVQLALHGSGQLGDRQFLKSRLF